LGFGDHSLAFSYASLLNQNNKDAITAAMKD
jgi:hypothetical protein